MNHLGYPRQNRGELPKLVDIIANAVHVAENRLAEPPSSDYGKPTAGNATDPQLRAAVVTIQAACDQLSTFVARPIDTLVNRFMAHFEIACMHVALANKIPNILEDYPSGMHVSEIAKRAGLDQGKLCRILRLLATRHLFQEVDKDTFANNFLSKALLFDGLSNFGLHITDECFKAAGYLNETLTDPEIGSSSRAEESAFGKHFGDGRPLWMYYEGPTQLEKTRGERFGRGMMGWGNAVEAEAVVYEFPWAELKDGATVCDFGGGTGVISMQLAKRYPSLRMVLQDLPKQIEIAQTKTWPENCPEAIADDRVEFIPFDFFKEIPRKGCDVYLLKNILHDWSDERCVKILENVRDGMDTHSRVLIQEFIIEPAYRIPESESQFRQAPEPLLPNYGNGRIRQYNTDVDMLVMLNSLERSLDDFIRIGNEAGLQFVKLWDIGEMHVVEFSL